MQETKIKILSTRPVGKALIQGAALHNIIIEEISFITTEKNINIATGGKIEQLSKQSINAVFTSMNAVEAVKSFIQPPSSWKIFCIGNTTRKLAESIFGKKNIAATAGNALHLAENIISDQSIKKVYFFCGNQRRDDLPEKLTANNISVEELIVYKTIQTPQKVTQQYDGILFFSPSGVHSFFMKNAISYETQLFAIGTTTADALKPFSKQDVIVADMPGKENLIAKAIDYFSKTQVS